MTGGGISVLGAGAWGTALATAFARTGADVRLWGRDAVRMEEMSARRENAARLPGIRLDDGILVTGDLGAALAGANVIVAAVPTQVLRALAGSLVPVAPRGVPIVVCAKGIERGTGRLPSEIVGEVLPGCPTAILSGPSFAADVGRGLPTAVTIAAGTLQAAGELGGRLGSASLRLYHTDDMRGVEIGGAAKNVLAIACGIAAGRGLGPSAAAALTARAFAELARFGRAFGGRAETLAGLSGLGDLVLTCGSAKSRNFSYGVALGRGERPDAAGGAVVEGVWTAAILMRLAQEQRIEMPIAAAVAAVLDGGLDVDAAIEQLMRRPLRAEG